MKILITGGAIFYREIIDLIPFLKRREGAKLKRGGELFKFPLIE